jgi:hypothetical protein
LIVAFFAGAIALGVVIGWATGGRLRAVVTRPLRLPLLPLGVVALYVVRIVTIDGASRVSRVFLIAALGTATAWIVANAVSRPPLLRFGVLTVAAGWVLNAATLVAKADLARLRDVLSIEALSLHLSVGDLVMAAGLVVTVAASMRRPGMTASSNRPFRRTKSDVFVKGA